MTVTRATGGATLPPDRGDAPPHYALLTKGGTDTPPSPQWIRVSEQRPNEPTHKPGQLEQNTAEHLAEDRRSDRNQRSGTGVA